MEQNAVYVKVGLLVTIFLVLIVGAVIVLGGAELAERVDFETYLSESVTGLDKGAAVKFRGVPIGSVEEIGFTRTRYGSETPLIWIRMSIRRDQLDIGVQEDLDQRVREAIEEGLRVRLASGGLTGAMYLEVDFLDEKAREWQQPIKVNWTPEFRYIPAAPSTMARLQKGVDEILADLSGMDLTKTTKEIRDLVVEVRQRLGPELQPVVDNVRKITAELPEQIDEVKRWVTEDLKGDVDRMADSVTNVIDRDVKGLINDLESDLEKLSGRVDGLIAHIEKSVTERVDPTVDDLRAAVKDLPSIITNINRSLRRIDRLAMSNTAQVEEALTNVRVFSADIRELVETLKRQPAGAIFGGPPPRVRKEAKK